MDTIDPQIKNLVSAIGRAETGNPSPDAYTKKGPSGEFGRYQFMPDTYKAYAKKYIGDENAQPTVTNQNKIAYSFVKEKKDAGFNPAQIASMWNAGEGKPNAYKENFRGINSAGVAYDTPAYAQKVSDYYNQLKGQAPQQSFSESIPQTGSPEKQPTTVGSLIREGIKSTGIPSLVASGINAVQTVAGKPVTETFHSGYLGDVKRVGSTFDPAKGFLDKENLKAVGDATKKGVGLATTLSAGKGLISGTKAVATKGVSGVLKGADVLESKAVMNSLKKQGLPNPETAFKTFSNAEKVEALTAGLKDAGVADRAVIQQALDKVLPQAIKEAGGKIAFSKAYPKLAKVLKLGKGIAKTAITGTILGSAINKGEKLVGLLK